MNFKSHEKKGVIKFGMIIVACAHKLVIYIKTVLFWEVSSVDYRFCFHVP